MVKQSHFAPLRGRMTMFLVLVIVAGQNTAKGKYRKRCQKCDFKQALCLNVLSLVNTEIYCTCRYMINPFLCIHAAEDAGLFL